MGEGAGQAAQEAGKGAGQAAQEVGEGASEAAQGVGDTAGQAAEGVGDVAGQATERADEAAQGAQDSGDAAGDEGDRTQPDGVSGENANGDSLTTQRTVDESGDIIETTMNENGEIVGEEPVGNVGRSAGRG